MESFNLKKSSSEFFDSKKKKIWSNLFSGKERKILNSSSQIFIKDAEKEGMVLDKMDNMDLKEALSAPKGNKII